MGDIAYMIVYIAMFVAGGLIAMAGFYMGVKASGRRGNERTW